MGTGFVTSIIASIVVVVTATASSVAMTTAGRVDLDGARTTPPAPTLSVRIGDEDPVVFPLTVDAEAELVEQAASSAGSLKSDRLQGRRVLRGGTFAVAWDLAIDSDPNDHAALSGGIVLANRSDVPLDFVAVLSMPISPLIDGPTELGGRVEVVLENDGDGGRLEVAQGDALVCALFDGQEVHRLHRGPFVMGGPSAGITSADAQFGAPIPSKGAGPIKDAFGCRMKAALTAGDEVRLSLGFVIAGSSDDFIRRRSTAPVRIEAGESRRVIKLGGQRSNPKGRRSGRGASGTLSIAPSGR